MPNAAQINAHLPGQALPATAICERLIQADKKALFKVWVAGIFIYKLAVDLRIAPG
jgi:hypothetical protein